MSDEELKAKLLAPRLPKPHDVELPGIGTVSVRGLSRAEVLELQDVDGRLEFERKLVSLGMVRPAMTPEDVAAWQAASLSDEIETITKKISELSGLEAGARKRAYKSVRS